MFKVRNPALISDEANDLLFVANLLATCETERPYLMQHEILALQRIMGAEPYDFRNADYAGQHFPQMERPEILTAISFALTMPKGMS